MIPVAFPDNCPNCRSTFFTRTVCGNWRCQECKITNIDIEEKSKLQQAIELLSMLENGMDLDITWRGEEIKGTLVTPELMERINLFLKKHHV